MTPVIGYVISISILNKTYRSIATSLTEWENHKTQKDFDDVLIVKRFLFEAFDCYIALFYVAFFMRDPVKLRAELVSLYTVDTIRRITTETLLPYALQHQDRLIAVGKVLLEFVSSLAGWQAKAKARKSLLTLWREAVRKKIDEGGVGHPPREHLIEEQVAREEYEEFDDYLEMVIQFGYITLFASACPLASFWAILCNTAEVYSDAFKLRYAYRRPIANAASGMPNTWRRAIKCMCWASIVTNVLLFGFVSEQAMQFFPTLFQVNSVFSDEHQVKRGGVWILLGLENLLLVAAAAISTLVPMTPMWARVATGARDYRRQRMIRADVKKRQAQVACTSPSEARCCP